MSQSRKKRAGTKLLEKTPGSQAMLREPKRGWTGYIIVSLVIALILIIVGVFYYQQYVAPFSRTVIRVDDTTVSMGDVLKRARLSGTFDSMALLGALTNEQLVKIGAPRYGIEVSPEEVDRELRRRARGETESISEGEFKEWYRQQLNETRLSDSEYREIVHTQILTTRLHQYLRETSSQDLSVHNFSVFRI